MRNTTNNVVNSTIEMLQKISKQINNDESSFRARALQSLITKSLIKLEGANVVKYNGDMYRLNNSNRIINWEPFLPTGEFGKQP